MNTITILGKLVRDPEIRSTQTGKIVASASVVVRRAFKGADGTDADFFEVTIWGTQAEFLEKYGKKSSIICVTGSMQADSFTDKDGNKRKSWKINASSIDLPLPTRGEDDPSYNQQSSKSAPKEGDDDYDPFADE